MELSPAQREWIGSTLLMVVGAGTMYLAFDYELGTPRSMGAGFFPFWLGGALIALSIANIVVSCLSSVRERATIHLREPLLVLASLFAFGMLMFTAGLIAAIVVSVMISSLASENFSPIRALMLGCVLAVCAILVFRVGLGQPLPLLGTWLVN